MKILKLVIFAGLCLSPSGFSAQYSLQAATDAAGKLLPGQEQFALYNIPEQTSDVKPLLVAMEAMCLKKASLAIVSPKLEWVKSALTSALAASGLQNFEGLSLVIIADKNGKSALSKPLLERGIKSAYGVYGK